MKLFPILPLSSFLEENSAYPYDVQDIPEPSRQSYFQYSTLHSQPPKNDDPNIFYSTREIPVEEALMNGPLECGHFHYRMSGLADHDIFALNHLLKRDNDISF